MPIHLDARNREIKTGDEVTLIDYSGDLLRLFHNTSYYGAVDAAIGKNHTIVGFKDRGNSSEIILSLPSSAQLAKTGHYMVSVSRYYVEKVND